jgi:hypothetical protein
MNAGLNIKSNFDGECGVGSGGLLNKRGASIQLIALPQKVQHAAWFRAIRFRA